MNLVEIGSKYQSDKGYLHAYYEVYDVFFSRLRDSAKKVLEIGTYNGESLRVWREYFTSAHIVGADIFFKPLYNLDSRISFHLLDAYKDSSVDVLNDSYDIIIDDGPHNLDSQIFFIKNYLPLLSSNGILVIEDILSYEAARIIGSYIPDQYKRFSFLVDRGIVPGVDGSSLLLFVNLYE